jgi:uncharacterized protein
MEIRDPIHGFINPTDTEIKIIDTPIVQRLRRIKQLAMAYLVYPGANHTRFDHSLGVMYVAKELSKKLLPSQEDEDKRRIIGYAALLHDIGHGPFSHTSEYILDRYYDNKSNPTEKIHEKITAKLVDINSSLIKLISEAERKQIIQIIEGKSPGISIIKEIVSGPLDADKLDYLLRDSYFCGVKYGLFDIRRLMNTLTSVQDSNDYHVGIEQDGVHSLEQYTLAKYYMATQVYYHKIRTLTDAMIKRGIELGIEEDNVQFLAKAFTYKDNDEFINAFIANHDDKLISDIITSSECKLSKLVFSRLRERNLFTRVFSEKLNKMEITADIRDTLIDINKKKCDLYRKEIEKQIAKINKIKCDPRLVIINSFTKSLARFSNISEGQVSVKDKETIIPFEDNSQIFKSVDTSIRDHIFEVYVPFEYENKVNRDAEIRLIKNEILDILKAVKTRRDDSEN